MGEIFPNNLQDNSENQSQLSIFQLNLPIFVQAVKITEKAKQNQKQQTLSQSKLVQALAQLQQAGQKNKKTSYSGPPTDEQFIQMETEILQAQKSGQKNKSNLKSKQKLRIKGKADLNTDQKQESEKTVEDDIATSSTDDMFAFSQIIASGQKVNAVTAQLDAENKKAETKPKDDEDEAILAFSNTLPGNDGAPVESPDNTEQAAAEAAAQKELLDLSTNDATAAFAMLVSSEDEQVKIQQDLAKSQQEQPVTLAQISSGTKSNNKQTEKTNSNNQQAALIELLQKNLQDILAKTQNNQPQNSQDSSDQPDQSQAQTIKTDVPVLPKNILQTLKTMKLTPEQLQSLAVISSQQQTQTEQTTEKPAPKSEKPIDQVEKNEQPADNDDDEKLADNYRKMTKIQFKEQEIKKLKDTQKALTQDALKQAKTGQSMKKIKHNLKIAKSVAKRVEDLKQQVNSDKNQLQPIKNAEEVDKMLPFKQEIHQEQPHKKVSHIPSVKSSMTDKRHDQVILGSLVQGTKADEEQQILSEIESAKKQILKAQNDMKKMNTEEQDFHNRLENQMSQIQKTFQEGFQALQAANQKQQVMRKDEGIQLDKKSQTLAQTEAKQSIQQEADLLNQAKQIADKQVKPIQDQELLLSDDNDITTQELQDQAQKLVDQVQVTQTATEQALVVTADQPLVVPADAQNVQVDSQVDAQTQIAQLLSKIQELKATN